MHRFCCLFSVLALVCSSVALGKTINEPAPVRPNVIGGAPARPDAYPWIAAIVRPAAFGNQPIGCAGSLIEPQWVLTAAHCLFDPDTGTAEVTEQLEVLLGTNNLFSGGQRIAVAQQFVHPAYDFDDLAQRNDIALLRLASAATQVPIAPLTPSQAPLAAVDRIARVAGWGATDNAGNTVSFDTLLDVALPVISDTTCNAQSENNAATQLCAGGEINRDSCPGDSGGPLVVALSGGRSVLAGVVSRGPNAAPNFCGDSGFAGIYTRVSAYFDWLTDTIETAQPRPGVIASAVLPSSRSVAAGQPATAFMSIVNAGEATAQRCRPLGPRGLGDALFSFTATDPLTNMPNASQNVAVDIPPGAARSFVFSLTRRVALESAQLPVSAFCDNTGLAGELRGVNDLIFSASARSEPQTADIIALGTTAGNTPGVVELLDGQAAFAVATSNAGATADVTVSASTGEQELGVSMVLCETTGSSEGLCLAPAAAEIVVTMAAEATHSFSVFVAASTPVAADFARNRIDVRFADSAGTQRGGTSVAVRSAESASE